MSDGTIYAAEIDCGVAGGNLKYQENIVNP